jgi:3-hydroxyisobutyrate dehydrogenase
MARLGWIGLGRLGGRLAPRLIAAGHDLVVHDLDAANTVPGAARASTAVEVASMSDAVFLCVTDTDAVDAVAREIAAVSGAGKLVVDHSSIHPGRTREIAARLRAANGMAWVDAPVSGPAGTCAVFLGGEAGDVARARPWIAAYAGRITHMGPLGSGQIAKSASQLVVSATVAAWEEAIDYARANGLDPAAFLDACVGAGSDSGVRGHFGPDIVGGRLAPESLRNMSKDMEIVCDMARGSALSMPLAQVVRSRFAKGDAS